MSHASVSHATVSGVYESLREGSEAVDREGCGGVEEGLREGVHQHIEMRV